MKYLILALIILIGVALTKQSFKSSKPHFSAIRSDRNEYYCCL